MITCMHVLDFRSSDLGLSAAQLKAFTSFYSSMPQLQLSRLLMERDELQERLPVGNQGLCFRELLTLAPRADEHTPQGFEHRGAVEALVNKMFESLSRWVHAGTLKLLSKLLT